MWRNYVSPRQVVEELAKFIRVAEFPPANGIPGTALADVGFILVKLKEQLLFENKYLSAFPADFVSRNNNGIELLLRTLVIFQRMLHQVPNASRISTFLNRSASNRKRKSAVAEADCLECLKILLEKTNAWAFLMDIPGNVEVILFSVNSPQLDSKCYALEIAKLLLSQPSGFIILLRALTTIAANNRDDNRISLLTTQLKHGLNTSKLHIQILIVRLLNAMIMQAPSFNYRILTQIEAENAGFTTDRVEQIVTEQGRLSGVDSLMRELAIWKNNLLPISFLQRSADQSTARNVRHDFPVSSVGGQGSYRVQSSDEDTIRSERSRRMYDMSANRPAKHNPQAPVARQRLKRYIPGDSERRRRNPEININGRAMYPESATGMVHPSQQSSTYFPSDRANNINRSFENLHSPLAETYKTEPRNISRHGPSSTLERPKSPRMSYPVKRVKSEGTVFVNTMASDDDDDDDRVDGSRSLPRNSYRIARPEQNHRKPRGLSRSLHELNKIDEPPSESDTEPKQKYRPMEPMVKLEPLEPVEGSRENREYRVISKPPPAPHPLPRDENRPISPKSVKMEGFSYLFPNEPVTANVVTRRRSKTPDPNLERSPPVRELAARPPSAPIFAPPPSTSTPQPPKGGEHVVYIPVRIEGTDRLMKPKRSIMKNKPEENRASPSQQSIYSREQAPSSVYSMGEDVKDALSRFDYLNEYETSSRGSRYGAN